MMKIVAQYQLRKDKKLWHTLPMDVLLSVTESDNVTTQDVVKVQLM